MSQLQDRIAQFRKMANDDPDNELGHYRLGQLLMEAEQYDEAAQSFRRTLELSPQFSKVYQLLAQSLLQLGRRDEAVQVLRAGLRRWPTSAATTCRATRWRKMLVQLGEAAPAPKKAAAPAGGGRWLPLPAARLHGRLAGPPAAGARRSTTTAPAQKIMATVCADCWNDWLRNMSIKVINELRLDLSTERGAEEYDRYMREYLGLE